MSVNPAEKQEEIDRYRITQPPFRTRPGCHATRISQPVLFP